MNQTCQNTDCRFFGRDFTTYQNGRLYCNWCRKAIGHHHKWLPMPEVKSDWKTLLQSFSFLRHFSFRWSVVEPVKYLGYWFLHLFFLASGTVGFIFLLHYFYSLVSGYQLYGRWWLFLIGCVLWPLLTYFRQSPTLPKFPQNNK